MFDEVVLETETGLVGGLLSSKGSKLKVVFGTGELPVEKVRGKDFQTIKFPSLTFLKRVCPEHVNELWTSEPEYVLHLALGQLPPEKRNSREVGQLLRQGPVALEANAKTLGPLFAKLESSGAIKLVGGKSEKFYELAISPEAKVPTQFEWLCEDETPTKSPSAKASSRTRKSTKIAAVDEAPEQVADIPSNEVDAGSKPLELVDYLAALVDEKEVKPADFDDWLASPFDRAVEISNKKGGFANLKLKEVKAAGFSLIALLPSSIWHNSKENLAKVNKIKNAALLKTIAANWEKDWTLLPHFEEISKWRTETVKNCSPIELLRVLSTLGRAGVSDSALAHPLLTQLMADPKSNSAISAEKKKLGQEAISGLILSAISSFTPGTARTSLVVRTITKWGEAPDKRQIDGYSLLQLEALLGDYELSLGGRFQARGDSSYVKLMRIVSEVAQELLKRVGDLESSLSILRVQSEYVLDLDPELVAKYTLSSFKKVDRLQPVATALSGMSSLREVEQERDGLQTQLVRQNTQLKSAIEDLEKVQAELAELRKRALGERQTQVSANKESAQELATPTLRILARSLSAALEFLHDNPGAVGRFEILADQAGLSAIGAPGEGSVFDAQLHSDPENEAQPGDLVEIHNVGFRLDTGDDSKVLLKAIVIKKQ